MLLEIENPDNYNLDEFCVFVIATMQEYVQNHLSWNNQLAQSWEDYFRSRDLGWTKDAAGQSVCPALRWLVDEWFLSLRWFSLDSSYYIIPDRELKLNSTEITIDSLARLVNFGNLEMAPYRVFEDVLDLFAAYLPKLFVTWSGFRGGD